MRHACGPPDGILKDGVLVTLADGNYVDQAKQLFSSVFWNAGWCGDYLLLAHGIPESELRWFRERGIRVRPCNPVLSESDRYVGHAPLTTLCKFELFTPEFRQWRQVVFLDGDVMARGSLETPARVSGFGAVRILNVFRTTLRGQFHAPNAGHASLFRELERTYDLDRPAFNAGMMAFSTDLIADDDFSRLCDLFFRFRDVIFIAEESVLNLHFYDRWQPLSQVYNVCPNYERYLSRCRSEDLRGVVLHPYSNFPGGKPWKPQSPLRAEWQTNLERAVNIDPADPRPAVKSLTAAEERDGDISLRNLHRRHRLAFWRYKLGYQFHSRLGRLKRRLNGRGKSVLVSARGLTGILGKKRDT
jgi:hypothetical protein